MIFSVILAMQKKYLLSEGNLKIILYLTQKNTKEIIINHKGTRKGWLRMEKINTDYKPQT